jgi:hypothetical protein
VIFIALGGASWAAWCLRSTERLLTERRRDMGATLSQCIVDRMSWLDTIAEKVQLDSTGVIKGGVTLRDALDGTWLGAPLHRPLRTYP